MTKIKETLFKKMDNLYGEIEAIAEQVNDIANDCERIDEINDFLEALYYMTPDEVAEKAQDLIDGAGRFVLC